MRNVRNTIWNVRIPPFLGALLLMVSLGTITWLTGNTVLFGTKAAADDTPKNVQMSNITDTSFTVSYKTDAKVIGSLAYGTSDGFGAVALDERDASASAEHWIHSITVKNLTPATKYYFALASGNDTFINGGVPYEITTAPAGTLTPSSQTPLVGTVQTPTGTIPTEAIAYISITDGQLLSSIVKVDGSYDVPLNMIRKKDLTTQLSFPNNTPILVTIEDATMKSNVYVIASQTNPVPLVILSKDYNFGLENAPVPASSGSTSAAINPVIFPTTANTDPAEPKIITPEQDQSFKDQQPLFKGKAVPNTVVEITIHSDQQIKTTVKADDNGNWEYRPATPLDPGEHTFTIETPNSAGIMQTLTQQFVVFAEGSQFTDPTGSPTKTVPSPTKAVVTPVPTQPATPTIAATTSATVAPTIIASPSVIITQPPIPQSGSSTMIMGIIATIFFISIGALVIAL